MTTYIHSSAGDTDNTIELYLPKEHNTITLKLPTEKAGLFATIELDASSAEELEQALSTMRYLIND